MRKFPMPIEGEIEVKKEPNEQFEPAENALFRHLLFETQVRPLKIVFLIFFHFITDFILRMVICVQRNTIAFAHRRTTIAPKYEREPPIHG